ncbi:MAG: helix-turn-helix transcriptional regulator [Firmicutes bacterium]|nr:helix-turn-helix transcriptional regulator [Bacillota bacterium]
MRRTSVAMIPAEDGRVVPVPLPCVAAEEQHTLERGARPYSVEEILTEVFREDFREDIQAYMDARPEEAAGMRGAEEVRLLRLSEPGVESSLRQPACTTAVDLVFRATAEALVPAGEEGQAGGRVKKRFSAAYRLRYLLGLYSGRCSAPVIAREECFPRDVITRQEEAVTNRYLLPVLYAEDYPLAAARMLERYYPEALRKPTAVDGRELAGRMGLHVRRVRFEKGSDIQGRIYFEESLVTYRDEKGKRVEEKVPAMTVLINRDLCPTPEIENSTLVHECCHVYLDTLFFRLQRLSGRPLPAYTSRKRNRKRFAPGSGPVEWMELQAEKLPAYLLMEERNTRQVIRELLAAAGGDRSPESMYRVVCRLAEVFQVSRAMAKVRMIELGYTEAEGVYAYIDNVRIPDYGCGGAWGEGITYAIARADAGALLRESKPFAEALRSGRYTYAEGHYCLNAAPYIVKDGRHGKHLSAYARHHIEECCISFTVQGRYAGAVYEDAKAARKTPVKDKYQSRHGLGAEPETKARVKENTLFAQDAQLWAKMKSAMPDSLGEAVQMILDEKGISQMELAMRMGVSRAAWRKWCAERMSLRHVTAICIALDVRGDIGLELVRLAGRSFLNNREDNLLLSMLFETADMTVARANDIMREQKLPPLTEGRDEELAG